MVRGRGLFFSKIAAGPGIFFRRLLTRGELTFCFESSFVVGAVDCSTTGQSGGFVEVFLASFLYPMFEQL